MASGDGLWFFFFYVVLWLPQWWLWPAREVAMAGCYSFFVVFFIIILMNFVYYYSEMNVKI